MPAAEVSDQLRLVLVAGPAVGGLRGHLVALANTLAENHGVRVTVAAPELTLEPLRKFHAPGVALYPLPIGSSKLQERLLAKREVGALAAAADVIHAHGLRAGWTAATARHTLPTVVTWHNAPISTGPRLLLHRWVEGRVARSSALTLAVSPDLQARAIAAGAPRTGLIEIPVRPLPAVRVARDALRSELGIEGERPVVLLVGRLEQQKRIDVAITTAAGWEPGAGPVLLVAGEGPLRDELQAQVTRLNAPVRLLGWRSDIADLLNAADVALLTSDWEGWPAAAVDALRARVPLVATAVGGLPRLVADAAELVPAADPHATRAALQRVLTRPELAESLGQAGLVQAATWQDVAENSEQHYLMYLDLTSR